MPSLPPCPAFVRSAKKWLRWTLIVSAWPAHGEIRYDAFVDPDLSTLSVEAQFPAPVPAWLEAGSDSARAYLRKLSIGGRPTRIDELDDGRIDLPASADALRLAYAVDLKGAGQEDRLRRFPTLGEQAVLVQSGAWLWLPPRRAGERIVLRFRLPQGMSISAPWPELQDGESDVGFVLGDTPYDWPALIAIGRFKIERIAIPGAELRLALLHGTPAPDASAVRQWIHDGASAVAGLYGRFPLAAPQILVVPIGRGEEPVPWGQVLRGGGPAAHLFIDQTRAVDEFRQDWVLVHELSHMVHPNLHEDGPWLAEGLATYYQYVLRSRAGLLTEQQAWQKLHEGFQRGIAQTRHGVTLEDATRSMLRDRIFMRVYWSGAALALLADLALREDGKSLDLALQKFRECCLVDMRIWSAAEFLDTLDRLTGMSVLMPLYQRYQHSDQFPDLGAAYRDLGLQVRLGAVVLEDDAPAVALRRAIMGGAH